ncbi:uncharacterized protein LOC122628551 isoform X2 [Vespula pensylvanica]|uniref:uncharacterized protein LOC122628551 isoform X2 n=1 Tax=Vespula pensylvanica TaxID=30213 RepID=UPI001CB9F976|nr:uncharacterized protein LOC122628551 isoform X2 [Vespula pensylvanica]
MGRSCRELWKDYHFVLKIVTFECCMIIATALMLLISAFVLMYDYYEDDGVSELDRRTRSAAKSFAICVGLTILAIVILIIDVILLIIKGGKGGRGATRGRGETTE